MALKLLHPGDPVPPFRQRTAAKADFAFDSVAGRYVVLCLFATMADPHAQAAIQAVRSRPDFFDDLKACFFGISLDPMDESAGRVRDHLPGYRYFWDADLRVARVLKAVPRTLPAGETAIPVQRHWLVLDPMLRVLHMLPFREDRSDIPALLACLDALPPPERFAGCDLPAPIIVLPNVFEADLCRQLIALYDDEGGQPSGVMREIEGRTVGVADRAYKRRNDVVIRDTALITTIQDRFRRRVIPEIRRVFQFHATRMERYMVACYDAREQGYFHSHRDNTTKGTQHRRFAVSVQLNDDFAGGGVVFPEYGSRSYRAPTGGVVIFSCGLLHGVRPVTAGRRLVCVPFLYDEAGARLRERNNSYLGEGVGAYRSQPAPVAGGAAQCGSAKD